MNYTYIKDKIKEVLIPKYKGKLTEDEVSLMFKIKGDIHQILNRMKSSKLIRAYDPFSVNIIKKEKVVLSGNVYISSNSKIKFEMELVL